MENSLRNELFGHLFGSDQKSVDPEYEGLPDREFLVIPGNDGPRWLVPAQSAFGLSVLKRWRPYGSISQFKWSVLVALYGMGILARVPGVASLHLPATSIRIPGAPEWSANCVPVVYIGTASPYRKLVATLVDVRTHRAVAIFKASLSGQAGKARIVNEARLLQKLSHKKIDIAPDLLFLDEDRGVSMQSVIFGKASSKKFEAAHLDFLVNLRRPGEYGDIGEAVANTRADLSGVEEIDVGVKRRIEKLFSELSVQGKIPSVWAHGDFAPWNLIETPHAKLCAVDWESGTEVSFPLEDILHFHTMVGFLFGRANVFGPALFFQIRTYMGRVGVSLEYTNLLVLLALVRELLTCHRDRDESRALFLQKAIISESWRDV